MAEYTLPGDLPPLQSIKPRSKRQLAGPEALPFEQALLPATPMDADASAASVCRPIPGVIAIDGVLSAEECASLRAQIDSSAALTFWSGTSREDEASRSFRDADTIEVRSEALAFNIWSRVRPLLPELFLHLSVSREDIDRSDDIEKEALGQWAAVNLNEDLLLAKYPPLGAFAPHTGNELVNAFGNNK